MEKYCKACGKRSPQAAAFCKWCGINEFIEPLNDFEINGTALINYRGKGGNVVIPANVTEIGDKAFSYCSGVKSVILPARESINDLHPTSSYIVEQNQA